MGVARCPMKTILVDAVGTLIDARGDVRESLYELLESYPHRKIIVTDADDDEMRHYGFDRAPYRVFTLKHAPDKTDPAYYTTLLGFFRFDPDDVVAIEHDPEVVANAEIGRAHV